MTRYRQLLDVVHRHWSINILRPHQDEALRAHLNGRDSLIVLPTGSGKSLCYQAPAAMLKPRKLTVVVSPLIALMQDQVDSLTARGIPAAFLNSTQHPREQRSIEANAVIGTWQLLYVSAERFASPQFLTFLYRCNVGTIVVDEAHCISQWGSDFRPAYAALGDTIAKCSLLRNDVSLHAYTATATPAVRQEIIASLQLRNPLVVVGDFDRPGLSLRVQQCPGTPSDRSDAVVDYVLAHPGVSGIVYCITRAATEQLAEQLTERGVSAAAYHAGLDSDTRRKVQERFTAGECDVVVATIAFGMGLNKSNVRFVFHAAMPSSLEVYHQEIGRAGRDGHPAECVLFYRQEDIDTWEGIFAAADPCLPHYEDGYVAPKLCALSHMAGFCETDKFCRRARLLGYFDETSHQDCGNCDVCLSRNTRTDARADLAIA